MLEFDWVRSKQYTYHIQTIVFPDRAPEYYDPVLGKINVQGVKDYIGYPVCMHHPDGKRYGTIRGVETREFTLQDGSVQSQDMIIIDWDDEDGEKE